MKTLDKLLAEGARLAKEKAMSLAAKRVQEEYDEGLRLAQIQMDASSKAKEHLGELFDEMNVGGQWSVNSFYNPPQAELVLRFGLKFVVCGNLAQLHWESSRFNFPCTPEALAEFVFTSKQTMETKQAHERKNLEQQTMAAVQKIDQGGDEWERPESIEGNLEWRVKDYTDLLEQLQAAMARWRGRQMEAEMAKVKADEHLAEVQSKVWFDFAVWELKYACKATDSDDEGDIYTETAYSLEPEPDVEGDCPIVKYGGKVVHKKFYNLLSREEVPVTRWDDDVARAVCRRVAVDGAAVVVPPEGAVMLDTDTLPETNEGFQMSVKVSL